MLLIPVLKRELGAWRWVRLTEDSRGWFTSCVTTSPAGLSCRALCHWQYRQISVSFYFMVTFFPYSNNWSYMNSKYKVSPTARNRAAYACFGLGALLIRQALRNTLNGGSLVSKLHRLIKNLCSDTWIHVLLLSVHCERNYAVPQLEDIKLHFASTLEMANFWWHLLTLISQPIFDHFISSDQINLRWRRRIHLPSGPAFGHLAWFFFLSTHGGSETLNPT